MLNPHPPPLCAAQPGAQLGSDFVELAGLAHAQGLPDAIIGPSMGGTPESWIEAFGNATYGRLAMVSAHQYGNVNCSDSSGWSFVQRDTYRCLLG